MGARLPVLVGLAVAIACPSPFVEAKTGDALSLHLRDRSFFLGRDYYVLRSGDAQLIIQVDAADLGPAFSYLLYDARNSRQSTRKALALNYESASGFATSGLVVSLNGINFHALGHNTAATWSRLDGALAVTARWWASGVGVTETVAPLGQEGAFLRRVRLDGKDLTVAESVRVRLSLQGAMQTGQPGILLLERTPYSIIQAVSPGLPTSVDADGSVWLGSFILPPGGSLEFDSVVLLADNKSALPDALKDVSTMSDWIRTGLSSGAAHVGARNKFGSDDAVVGELFENCANTLPGYVAANGVMNAGIFEYGEQWVRDSSQTALGMLAIGDFAAARAIIRHILESMVTDAGTTMIAGGFDEPDREQFDQMGELMYSILNYINWTGDSAIIAGHEKRLLAMIERPLSPAFMDETGMVHNRREFWERTFDDAYELAYQTWVVTGLRCAAELAPLLGAAEKTAAWEAAADRMHGAMLHHPTRALVSDGALIKRRGIDGQVVDRVKFTGWIYGAPAQAESLSRLQPDSTMGLPIALGLVPADSPVARATLERLEQLWNVRWSLGGYDRYQTSSQGDQPGPWTFGTAFVLRAQHEAESFAASRRSLEWLRNNAGGRTGAWHEQVPMISAQAETSGLIPWTSAEVAHFVVHSLLGVRFQEGQLVVRPRPYPGTKEYAANLRFRSGRLVLRISGSGNVRKARIDGVDIPTGSQGVILPPGFNGGTVEIEMGP
ncbi:MAG: hypothetical protein SFV32_00570 [Opitutaceae bacterium]|nr:hypothetical protein [Opitutaceae bacterium]